MFAHVRLLFRFLPGVYAGEPVLYLGTNEAVVIRAEETTGARFRGLVVAWWTTSRSNRGPPKVITRRNIASVWL